MFNRIDQDKSGTIDYHEFLTSAVDYDKLNNKQNLKAAFELFDSNRDGNITCEELMTLFKAALIESDKAEVKDIIAELGLNKDNKVCIRINH